LDDAGKENEKLILLLENLSGYHHVENGMCTFGVVHQYMLMHQLNWY
jgi:hypothetical protein